jgi:hypothetical protein
MISKESPNIRSLFLKSKSVAWSCDGDTVFTWKYDRNFHSLLRCISSFKGSESKSSQYLQHLSFSYHCCWLVGCNSSKMNSDLLCCYLRAFLFLLAIKLDQEVTCSSLHIVTVPQTPPPNALKLTNIGVFVPLMLLLLFREVVSLLLRWHSSWTACVKWLKNKVIKINISRKVTAFKSPGPVETRSLWGY